MAATLAPIAVLTGDIVASSSLPRDQIEQAIGALQASADAQATWHGAPLHFTRHRGDGWQVVLQNPALALRGCLTFRAALRSHGAAFDSRIAVAIGAPDTPPGPDLNAETAHVFETSGQLLEAMSQAGDDGLKFATGGPLNAAAILADHLSRGWTPAQATTAAAFLAPRKAPSYTGVAKALGKSRQSVKKAYDAAGLAALTAALTEIESPP